MAPVVFSEADWQALAQLLHLCVHWYAAGELPQQLVQLVIEVSDVLSGRFLLSGSRFCVRMFHAFHMHYSCDWLWHAMYVCVCCVPCSSLCCLQGMLPCYATPV
jgi:hypothetical protein